MANILTAAASAAKERIKSTAGDVKDSVVNQFDPRQSIYQLGLGVGPLIRQTVAEMKKQQNKESKNADKGAKKDIGDIKRDTTKNAKSLQTAAMHLGSIDKSLKEIRKINNVQLQAQMKMIRAERITAGATTGADLMSIFKSSKSSDDTKSTSPQKDDEEGSTLGTIAKIGAGLAIGGVLWSNRAEIKKFLDQFLEGAGLPSTEKLADQAGKAIGDATVKVASLVGMAVVDGVKAAIVGLPGMIYDHIKEALGFGKDEKGNPLPANPKKLGADVGFAGGAYLGYKAGGWKGGILGGIAGGLAGFGYPEAALMAGGALVTGKMAASRYAASKAAQVAPTAPVAATSSVAVPTTAVPTTTAAQQTTRQERRTMFTEKYQELKNQGMGPGEARDAAKDYVKQQTTAPTAAAAPAAANAPAPGPTPTTGPSSVVDSAKQVDKDGIKAKSILKNGAIGGVLTGLYTYQQSGNVSDALITASLATGGAAIGTTIGAALGTLLGPAGTYIGGTLGNMAGGYLGQLAGDAINDYRNSGTPTNTVTPSSSPAGSTNQSEGFGAPMMVMKGSKGRFGEKRDGHIHAGVDIGGNRGDPVYALKNGTVVFAGTMNGYGNTVDIKYDDGTGSRMAHLDSILVQRGDKVKKGQKIGTVGSSGLKDPDAVHLHLEVFDQNGRAIDPRSVMSLPAYSGTDDGNTYAVNRMFTPGGGSGDGGDSSGGFGSPSMSGSPINVQALKSMGVGDDQIKAITENQKYLGEMGDLASFLPALMGMDISQQGGGGGSGSMAQTHRRGVGLGAASNYDVSAAVGSVNSPEKDSLRSVIDFAQVSG